MIALAVGASGGAVSLLFHRQLQDIEIKYDISIEGKQSLALHLKALYNDSIKYPEEAEKWLQLYNDVQRQIRELQFKSVKERASTEAYFNISIVLTIAIPAVLIILAIVGKAKS